MNKHTHTPCALHLKQTFKYCKRCDFKNSQLHMCVALLNDVYSCHIKQIEVLLFFFASKNHCLIKQYKSPFSAYNLTKKYFKCFICSVTILNFSS